MRARVGPGQRLAGKGELPAHEQHEAEAEEEKEEPAEHVLDADRLVVSGEDVGAPETELVVLVAVIVMRVMAVGRRRMGGRGVSLGAGREIVHKCGSRIVTLFSERAQRFLRAI